MPNQHWKGGMESPFLFSFFPPFFPDCCLAPPSALSRGGKGGEGGGSPLLQASKGAGLPTVEDNEKAHPFQQAYETVPRLYDSYFLIHVTYGICLTPYLPIWRLCQFTHERREREEKRGRRGSLGRKGRRRRRRRK